MAFRPLIPSILIKLCMLILLLTLIKHHDRWWFIDFSYEFRQFRLRLIICVNLLLVIEWIGLFLSELIAHPLLSSLAWMCLNLWWWSSFLREIGETLADFITYLGLIDTEHQRVKDCWDVVAVYLVTSMRRLNVAYSRLVRPYYMFDSNTFIKERTSLKSLLFTRLIARSTSVRLCSTSSIPYIEVLLLHLLDHERHIVEGTRHCISTRNSCVFL